MDAANGSGKVTDGERGGGVGTEEGEGTFVYSMNEFSRSLQQLVQGSLWVSKFIDPYHIRHSVVKSISGYNMRAAGCLWRRKRDESIVQ